MPYTPGPWSSEMFAVGDMAEMQYISQDDNYYKDDQIYICLIAGHELKHPQNNKRKDKRCFLTEESVANARLIAAAPELLAACQEFVKHIKSLGTDTEKCRYLSMALNCRAGDLIEKAIAKATGEQP
jgi:hypothetical protein